MTIDEYLNLKEKYGTINSYDKKYYCLNEGEPVCRCGNCEEIPTYLYEEK